MWNMKLICMKTIVMKESEEESVMKMIITKCNGS
jgi:hypothetical protein